jgi:hypothetical protein
MAVNVWLQSRSQTFRMAKYPVAVAGDIHLWPKKRQRCSVPAARSPRGLRLRRSISKVDKNRYRGLGAGLFYALFVEL